MSNEIILVVLAFVAGVLAHGAVRWAMKRDDADNENRGAAQAAEGAARLHPDKISEIETEIAKARSALDEIEDADFSRSAEMTALEDALKRANGRIKVIMKAITKN